MLTVSKFVSKLKGAAYNHHGDLSRDDLVPQFYTSMQYLQATAIIVFVLVYPTVLQWCATMWKCEEVVYGDWNTLRSEYYLTIDRSIRCTDSSHKLVQALALTAALIYGFGVPIASIIVVWRHWNRHGRVHTRRLYAYTTAGYDVTTWWFESVVMARKAVIVFIIIFVSDQILRTYLAMWTMTLALGAHGWFQPYDPRRPALYYLESIGIIDLIITLNLSLLFQFDFFAPNTTLYWVLVIFLFALNVFVIGLYVVFILIQLGRRIKQFVQGTKEVLDETQVSDSRRKSLGRGSFGFAEQEFTSFREMDRAEVQRQGILGALRRASQLNPVPKEDKQSKQINPAASPAIAGETPFERVQRLESEKAKEDLRAEQLRIQAELEKELEELRDRMIRAQALAAAEEAIIARHSELGEIRRKHEEDLKELMDEIRKERGEFLAKTENQKESQKELMQSIQFELDESEEEEGEETSQAEGTE
jgi:hypothetical protein